MGPRHRHEPPSESDERPDEMDESWLDYAMEAECD
jgi:hypothetical protein